MYIIIKFFIECGGKFTAPQGTIHTKNYPQNYDADSLCMWYIEIAETHLINLTFVDFSTRNFSSTNSDYVLVYDGDVHGNLLLNHSGNSIPPSIISSSNILQVSFVVGKHELRSKGFKAIYSTVINYCSWLLNTYVYLKYSYTFIINDNVFIIIYYYNYYRLVVQN